MMKEFERKTRNSSIKSWIIETFLKESKVENKLTFIEASEEELLTAMCPKHDQKWTRKKLLTKLTNRLVKNKLND